MVLLWFITFYYKKLNFFLIILFFNISYIYIQIRSYICFIFQFHIEKNIQSESTFMMFLIYVYF